MPLTVIADFWLCECCTFAHEFDLPCETGEHHPVEPMGYLREISGMVVLGDHDDTYSTVRCDGCGTTLGGWRMAAHALGEIAYVIDRETDRKLVDAARSAIARLRADGRTMEETATLVAIDLRDAISETERMRDR